LALVALPRINKLRAINIVISSTPAASTTIYIFINSLRDIELLVQCVQRFLEEAGPSLSPPSKDFEMSEVLGTIAFQSLAGVVPTFKAPVNERYSARLKKLLLDSGKRLTDCSHPPRGIVCWAIVIGSAEILISPAIGNATMGTPGRVSRK